MQKPELPPVWAPRTRRTPKPTRLERRGRKPVLATEWQLQVLQSEYSIWAAGHWAAVPFPNGKATTANKHEALEAFRRAGRIPRRLLKIQTSVVDILE